MASERQLTEQSFAGYAVARDFCRIFDQDMASLYLLSLLLTADRGLAEECFVSSLEESTKSPHVFQEWARSWARRVIVQKAIPMIGPQRAGSNEPNRNAGRTLSGPTEFAAILQLPAFQRFVFVMSTLERYSNQDCALLLDCTRDEVVAARLGALQQLGNFADAYRAPAATSAASGEQVRRDDARLALKLVPHLATTA